MWREADNNNLKCSLFMVYMCTDITKQNCNDLAIFSDGHTFYKRGRDKLRMLTKRIQFFLYLQ